MDWPGRRSGAHFRRQLDTERLKQAEDQTDLAGLLAVLDIDDKADAHVCRQGKILLAET
jgi:hypothetical protein